MNFIKWAANRFKNYCDTSDLTYDDLVQLASIATMRASGTHDPATSPLAFVTYAFNHIKWLITYEGKKSSARRKVTISVEKELADGFKIIDTLQSEQKTPDQIYEQKELEKLLHKSLEVLTPREKFVLELTFGLNGNDELPLREIAKILKCANSRISDIKNLALKKLRERLKS